MESEMIEEDLLAAPAVPKTVKSAPRCLSGFLVSALIRYSVQLPTRLPFLPLLEVR